MTTEEVDAFLKSISPSATLVEADRKSGDDKLNEAEKMKAEALAFFDAALKKHRAEVLAPMKRTFEHFSSMPIQDEDGAEAIKKLAAATADALGIEGGLNRRLDRPTDAASSYGEGAALEARYKLNSTYNRINTLLLDLFAGRATVEALTARAAPWADTFQKSEMKGKPWALADCGLILLFGGASANDAIEAAYKALAALRDFPAQHKDRVIHDIRKCELAIRPHARETADEFGKVADYLANYKSDPT